jgi:hypothetical protein
MTVKDSMVGLRKEENAAGNVLIASHGSVLVSLLIKIELLQGQNAERNFEIDREINKSITSSNSFSWGSLLLFCTYIASCVEPVYSCAPQAFERP